MIFQMGSFLFDSLGEFDDDICRLRFAVFNGWPIDILRQPITLSRTPAAMVRPIAEKGEDTSEILSDFGFSDAEIKAIEADNAT